MIGIDLTRGTIFLAVALILTACSKQTPVEDDAAQGAQQAFEDYIASINAGDTDKAAQIYDRAEGFRWVERGDVQYASGNEAAASLKESFPAGSRVAMEIDEMHSAEMGPDAALLSAHYTFSAFNQDGTPQYSFDGWMTVGMVKRAEGWRIAGGQTGPGEGAAEQP